MKKTIASAALAIALVVGGGFATVSVANASPGVSVSQASVVDAGVVKAGTPGKGTYRWWLPSCWFYPASSTHVCWY